MSTTSDNPLRPFDPRPPAQSTTHRALFGRLRTEDTVTGIVRRIRTAVGLGLLNDGDRLPKEAALAQQLGVTNFSLREALSMLRDEGLIVTRAGAKGGSFVRAAETTATMAGEDLVRMSATELRDLGDWHSTLLMSAARLAAQRHAGATGERLTSHAITLSNAANSAEAGRALGRFHVELAAESQSMRLTKAELVAHEEFDWLMQVVLNDSSSRAQLCNHLNKVASAVSDGDPTAAVTAASAMAEQECTDLSHARLRLLATTGTNETTVMHHGSGLDVVRQDAHGLAITIQHLLDSVISTLSSVAERIQSHLPDVPSAASLTPLVSHAIFEGLSHVDGYVLGLGFMADPHTLPDAPYWIKWWERNANGTFDQEDVHQLDPNADQFYDYGSQEYMEAPRSGAAAHAMGPYIDHGGVDDYMVTLSVPVRHRDKFVGIVGADVRVSDIERETAPWLAKNEEPLLLVNAESRVLLSTSVRHDVGDVLPAGATEGSTVDVARFGWRLLHLNEGTL